MKFECFFQASAIEIRMLEYIEFSKFKSPIVSLEESEAKQTAQSNEYLSRHPATSGNATRFPHYADYVAATVTNRYSKTPLDSKHTLYILWVGLQGLRGW